MRDAKISYCVVVNGTSYRTAHTASDAYSNNMVRRLDHRNAQSITTATDQRSIRLGYSSSEITAREHKAYNRVYPIFRKLLNNKGNKNGNS